MYAITAKVKDVNTTEGRYKNILIAKRHKRRLEKRYPGTRFVIERVDKDEFTFNSYYAVVRKYEREGGK